MNTRKILRSIALAINIVFGVFFFPYGLFLLGFYIGYKKNLSKNIISVKDSTNNREVKDTIEV